MQISVTGNLREYSEVNGILRAVESCRSCRLITTQLIRWGGLPPNISKIAKVVDRDWKTVSFHARALEAAGVLNLSSGREKMLALDHDAPFDQASWARSHVRERGRNRTTRKRRDVVFALVAARREYSNLGAIDTPPLLPAKQRATEAHGCVERMRIALKPVREQVLEFGGSDNFGLEQTMDPIKALEWVASIIACLEALIR